MNFLKSKTVWFGTALMVFGALQAILPELQSILTPQAYAIATSGVGFVVVLLRAVTGVPLSEK